MNMHDDEVLLAGLAAERTPPSELKQRTMEAARRAGHLRTRPSRTRAIALLIAASLIFVAGTLLGYALAQRVKPPARTEASANRDGLAATPGLNINTDPTRRVVWY